MINHTNKIFLITLPLFCQDIADWNVTYTWKHSGIIGGGGGGTEAKKGKASTYTIHMT